MTVYGAESLDDLLRMSSERRTVSQRSSASWSSTPIWSHSLAN